MPKGIPKKKPGPARFSSKTELQTLQARLAAQQQEIEELYEKTRTLDEAICPRVAARLEKLERGLADLRGSYSINATLVANRLSVLESKPEQAPPIRAVGGLRKLHEDLNHMRVAEKTRDSYVAQLQLLARSYRPGSDAAKLLTEVADILKGAFIEM